MTCDRTPRPRPTTITAIARTYHAAAVALAQSLGISLAEVLAQYPSAVSTVFIECSRCELRLPASVKLPPLVPPNGHGVLQPEASNRAIAEAVGGAHVLEEIFQPTPRPPRLPPKKVEEIFQAIRSIETSPAAREAEAPALPTTISGDGDLPCAGQEIALLKPAALAMLIAKVARLAHREGADWAPLLAALTRG